MVPIPTTVVPVVPVIPLLVPHTSSETDNDDASAKVVGITISVIAGIVLISVLLGYCMYRVQSGETREEKDEERRMHVLRSMLHKNSSQMEGVEAAGLELKEARLGEAGEGRDSGCEVLGHDRFCVGCRQVKRRNWGPVYRGVLEGEGCRMVRNMMNNFRKRLSSFRGKEADAPMDEQGESAAAAKDEGTDEPVAKADLRPKDASEGEAEGESESMARTEQASVG